MKVLLCGETFSTNLGDGIIADALSDMLSGSEFVTQVDCHDISGRAEQGKDRPVENTHALRTMHRKLYRRAHLYGAAVNWLQNRLFLRFGGKVAALERKLGNYDIVMIGGGQLLRDNRLSFPTKIETIVSAARRRNKPVVFFGIGVGEQWSKLGKYYFRKALTAPNVRSVHCRDKRSRERLEEELGHLSIPVESTFDAALGIVRQPEETFASDRVVGLCVMDSAPVLWTTENHLLAKIDDAVSYWENLARSLLESGQTVHIFTNGSPDDHRIAEGLNAVLREQGLDPERIRLLPRPTQSNELVELIRPLSCLIGFRLHACVIAYSLGIPCVALAWDDKIRQFMSYTGRDRYFVSDVRDYSLIVDRVHQSVGEPIDKSLRENIAADIVRSLGSAIRAASEPDRCANAKQRLAFFVSEDWYFCSHRMHLAKAALADGYDVHVITRVALHGQMIRDAGLNLIPLRISRRSKNLFREIGVVLTVARIYRKIKPSVVHHVAIKPVIYGTVAARLSGVPGIVNAMAGLGFLFISASSFARLFRPIVKFVFRIILGSENSRLILQNPDDVNQFVGSAIVPPQNVRLILGSGVDTNEYKVTKPTSGKPTVLVACRMLWDKGIGEFVEAARELQASGVVARFVLAGEGDPHNPRSVPDEILQKWHDGGVIDWIGQQEDMLSVFSKSHIVCLPSYREGVPKVLIEAASCKRPIVTTDVPGCREIVRDGVNGLLVPPKDADALARAIRRLLDSPELCKQMGQAGRDLVIDKFELSGVIAKTLAVYSELAH